MEVAAADGNEHLSRRWIRLSEAGLAYVILFVELRAPADGATVLTQGAGVISTAADGDEPFALWRRCLPKRIPFARFTPANGSTVLPQGASMLGTCVDGGETLVFRGSGLSCIVVSPAEGCAVFPQSAGMV